MAINEATGTIESSFGDRTPLWQDGALRQAYLLPRTTEELRNKRSGFWGPTDGASAFADGWTDYAHSLLAGWDAHEPFVRAEERGTTGAWRELYKQSERQRSVITTSLHPIAPLGDSRPIMQSEASGGIRLHGRQTFGAGAWFADELLLFIREEGAAHPTVAALIQKGTEGLRLIPAGNGSAHSESGPVVAAYEDVRIPAERLWTGEDADSLKRLLDHPLVKSLADYQWAARQLDAIELLAGTAFALAEETGRGEELHIQGELGELIQGIETLKALLHAAELCARPSPAGVLLPAPAPLHAALLIADESYGKAVRALQRIGAAAFLANPNNASPTSPNDGKPSLLQLAWGLTGSEASTRTKLHEQHAFGDSLAKSQELYRHYPVHLLRRRYQQFWQSMQPLDGKEESEVQI
ncbi:4-hydroxyphenylacetate 3-hydroxylase C-terminal domain-containing protein [Paenibacillus xanthanilyticus]|uniref:4-hydroxyphenylacetate 3-hydroxylase C-terminal domain-containing protein n=1 Tax=Paenibacillus xanthanilyticus TaxID=1783531 RepID=A0ABV8JYD9_9BACL